MPASPSTTRTLPVAAVAASRSASASAARGLVLTPSPKAVAHYSPIVRAGDWVVVSGQLGLLAGALVTGVGEQVRQALVNLQLLLSSENLALGDVVKTTVFLQSIDDFSLMNEVYAEAFGDYRPARSAVAVAGLPLGALVEIEAWALRPVPPT